MFISGTRSKKNQQELDEPSLPDEYTLIAADLSLKRPGFCKMHIKTIDDQPHINHVELVSVDNKTKTKPRGQLLTEIRDALLKLCQNTLPIYFVREKSVNNYGGKAARSGSAAISGISEVVGIADLVAWTQCNQEWSEIYPVSIKKIVTGNGKADKTEVANALVRYLPDAAYRNDDESDAAAVAVAWLITHNQIQQNTQEDANNEPTESHL